MLFQDGATKALNIRNTEADITGKLIVKLSGFTGKIILEATGHYHWLAAVLLSEAKLDVRAVNPLLASKYARSSIRKIKNDPADALSLANMALVEKDLPPPFKTTRQHLVLRKKIGFITSLKDQLQAMEASQKSFQEARNICGGKTTSAEQELTDTLRLLAKKIAKLETEFEEKTVSSLAPEQLSRLRSVPGVSIHLAALVAHWYSLSEGQSAKSWIGYAGLDVSTKESGTWRGRCRLTKRGNSYLRRRLYSAAWGAVMHDDRFQDWYQYLRHQGTGHVEALVIIARKIVRILYAVSKNQTPFDPSLPLYRKAI